MSDKEEAADRELVPIKSSETSPLVVRSKVAQATSYQSYREDLRWDFFYSCAYCNTMEFEAQGLRFTIDHYRPQISNTKLKADYSNLMWCCGDCNSRKGDSELPSEAVEAGYRFYKADVDDFFEHFKCDEEEIAGLTKVGVYTDTLLHLNRQKLRRIRSLRRELSLAQDAIVEGINGLRKLPIDQLPQRSKGEALVKSKRALEASENMQQRIDALLRDFAHSELVDKSEDDVEAQRGRRELLANLGAMFPGAQRGRDSK
jgi:uncharacterized protein (TIGR02646 family)